MSLTLKMYHSRALPAWLGTPSKTISSEGVKPLRDHFLVTALAAPTGWFWWGHVCRGSWDLTWYCISSQTWFKMTSFYNICARQLYSTS